MYSRSYIGSQGTAIPDGYDGIAIKESEILEKTDTYEEKRDVSSNKSAENINPWEAKNLSEAEKSEESVGAFSHLGSSLGNLLGGVKLPFLSALKMPKIGTEEILILIAAAYLLFSKDGDKECAIILILLLFIA